MLKCPGRLASLIVLLLFSMVILSGCGKQPVEEKKPAKFGVLDLNEVMQNHPLYEQYLAKRQQLEKLRWQFAQTAEKDNSNAELAENAKLTAVAGELDAKLGLLQTDWQRRIAEQENELQLQLEKKMIDYQAEIDARNADKLFNLRLRSVTLQMSQIDAEADQRAAEAIRVEKEEFMTVRHGELQQEKNRRLQALQQQARAEIDAFYQQGQEKLQTMQQAALADMEKKAVQQIQAPEQDRAIETAQNDILQLEASMKNDLEQAVARVAVKNGLDSVFTKVVVNISALEITKEVTAEIVKR